MEQLTGIKVFFCYSLMDNAYDAKAIDVFIRSHGRIPITDPNKRKGNERPPLDPAKGERSKIRTTAERANSYLKDSLIPCSIYVKGYKKVSFVLITAVMSGCPKVPPGIHVGFLKLAQVNDLPWVNCQGQVFEMFAGHDV
jgi:hypothetical protein